MARTSLAQFRAPQVSGASTTIVYDSISSVAAGSLIVVGWRYESGTGGVVTGVADTINGTPSGKTWYFYEFSDAPRSGVAYCFDHPGGSNVVVTVTNNDGVGRSYREGYGVVLSGTVGESDPRSLAQQTASTTDGTSSFTFSMPGDGTLFAMFASNASMPGFAPTSPASLVSTLSTPTAYGGAMLQFTTGSGSKTIASTGAQSPFAGHGIALAFNEPSVGPVITGPSGAAGAGSSTANIAENATTGPTFTTSTALGGGYPTLTGAQAANWAITALSSTSWRIDPVTPFNFEAGGLVNPQAIVFNASASVSQSCSVTVTNVNEAPTFSGTVSVPTLTQGSAMTPVNAGALFSDPDSGDTAAYSAVGVWPAGVTVDGSTGIISGTPSAAATYANLRVRRTDAGTLAADSNLFTITVAASGGVTFSGTVPAQSGTVGTAFSLALASYFSGTGTYEVQAGTLPPGLARDINTGAITGTPTTAGTFSGVVIRKTAASGSPATADTNAFAFTIAAAPAVAGFDMDTAAGCVFGAVAGSLTSISREVSVVYKVAVYNTSTRALIFESASLTTNSAGRLPRFTSGLCTVGVTYDLVAKRVSDGAIACFRLAAT